MANYFATHHFSRQVLNTYRGIALPGYANLFVRLFISDPTDTGTAGIELAYPGYTGQQIMFTPPANFEGNLAIRNTADITFPESSQSTEPVLHIGIFDSAVPGTGNMVLRGDLTRPLEIRANQQPSILAGDIIYISRGDFTAQFRTAYLNTLRGQTLQGFSSHLAMFDGNPESGGFELSGEAYARAALSFASPVIDPNTGLMTITNETVATFPTPLGTWGPWNYDCVMRGSSGAETASFSRNDEAEIVHRGYIGRIREGRFTITHD